MDPLDDEALPRAIALAWGVAANPQRGPRRELNIESIVDAAVQIADQQGLGAVSMSSVAGALGFTTMSLYRYVTAKDDLLMLMQEAGIGLPPLSITETDSWREGLIRWYRAVLDVYLSHPWILDIPITGEPNTPNNLAWLDAGLGVLKDSPLTAQTRTSAVVLIGGSARWEAQITRGYTPEGALASSRLVASLVTPEQFPYLYPAMIAGALEANQNPFEFGLFRLLDGLDRYMTETAADHSVEPVAAPVEPREVTRDERVKKARERVKDAEAKLRDARQKEREALTKAREAANRARERTES
jgi:AcrR family transcriptional regulator